ncbi:fibronectin type III domain-containing protein [Candidatus Woesearchaeota archaeon]|nr:fibronectin type III domain-containing protein [Candidatus Woesearchaeota archaeon]
MKNKKSAIKEKEEKRTFINLALAKRFISLIIIIIIIIISTIVNIGAAAAAPAISTDKQEYIIGEKVLIIVTNVTPESVVKIIFDSNIYKYMGDLDQQLEFLPSEIGQYNVSLEYYVNNNQEIKTSFIVNPIPEFPFSQETMQKIYSADVIEAADLGEPTPEQTQKTAAFDSPQIPTPENGDAIVISNSWLSIVNHDNIVLEKNMALFDANTGRSYSSSESSSYTPIGIYDAEIKLGNGPIKKILFRNLDAAPFESPELRIDDLSGNEEKAGTNSKQFYVIDPTGINFTSAYVTVTAKGEQLLKCKDWNYLEQRCYGAWQKIMDLTPGENYTFMLTPEDPAYNETSHDADNCYNEKAGRACNSTEIAAINANGGTNYPFHRNAGSPVRVSFSNETMNISRIVACSVYVDGYDNEGNTWTVQLGNWSTSTWDGAGTGLTSPNPEGNTSLNCLSHFNFSNDDARFDNFAIRVSTSDKGTQASAYIDYAWVVINFSVRDQTSPYYSNIIVNLSSPVTYSPTATYQFNVTWQDNEGINTTWIQHNFTTTMSNYSTTGNASSIYYYNYGNIAAGNYTWRMHANDTATNMNSTPWQTYTINKAASSVNLLLNNTDDNYTINNSGTVNITGYLVAGQLNISIYENGALILYGPNYQQQLRAYTYPGVFNITLIYTETQNYTANSETHFIIVNDTLAPGPVTSLQATSNGTTWIYWTWTNPTDADFNHTEIWINGTFRTNTTGTSYNATGLLSDTTYTIQIRTVDNWTYSSSNIGYFVNDTARTKSSGDTTPPIISNVQNTSITDTSATITWTTDEIATSVVKYGTVSGVYTATITNATLTTSHTTILTGLSAGRTYYYVVNSTDASANSNQSIEYNFTTLSDTTPPYYSNLVATPASPATYSPTAAYQFNATWQDNEGVNTTWIEHNFTGSFVNYSAIGRTSDNVSYYNYGPLGAGGYVWRMYANDTAHNLNNTMPWQSFVINQASSAVNLLLNNSDDDYSVNESESINITGRLVTGEGNITIMENGSVIIQGPANQTTIRTYLAPGTFNITLLHNATQNFTANSETHILTVNDTRAPWISLTDPQNGTIDYDGSIIFYFDVNDTSDVKNCSLYINGTYNQGKDILTKGSNTFTIDNLGTGNYSWFVNCSDYFNHTNVSVAWNVTVRIQTFYSHIEPISCSDTNGCTASNMNNTPNVWEEHGILDKNAHNYVYVNFSAPNISAGSTIDWMYIYYDKYQETTSGNFKLEWMNTSSGLWVEVCTNSYGSATLYAHDFVNCSFSGASMPNLAQINSGLQLRADFYYTDTAAQKDFGTDEAYINLKYTEDTTPPTVELIGPNSYHEIGTVDFWYIPNDLNLINCTLYGNFSGSWAQNISDTTMISGEESNLTITLNEGTYIWNVRCCDVANNCDYDRIGGHYSDGNYTVNITNPDLIVSYISFNTSDSDTKEGMNITINATIHNRGNVNATGEFKVQFFIGDPDSGGVQINENKTITDLGINENKTVNVSWVIDSGGARNIYVIVDPPLATNGSIKEINDTNNKNNKTLNVPSYNYFYGYTQNSFFLANSMEQTVYHYGNISNVTGNIFVADEESTVTFASLQALGRDTSNNIASNDFSDADTGLVMSSYNDSIRKIWTADTDSPLETRNMIIMEVIINNVPIINSTNSGSFITGILWDKSDGGTQYNGTQDLIFVTQINDTKTGAYGTYDYEIRVPANLKNYKGAGSNVAFFWEITQAFS